MTKGHEAGRICINGPHRHERITNIDAQDFSGKDWLAILSIGKAAPDHRPSRLPAQEPLVLSILLILCIHVHKK